MFGGLIDPVNFDNDKLAHVVRRALTLCELLFCLLLLARPHLYPRICSYTPSNTLLFFFLALTETLHCDNDTLSHVFVFRC